MSRFPAVAVMLVAALLAGCSTTGDSDDEAQQSAAELYEEARETLDNGRFQDAAEQLQDLQIQYPFGPYARQAQLDLIYAHYKAGEMGSAVRAADRFMRLHPQDENVVYARYMRGRAHLERGEDFLTRRIEIDDRTRDPTAKREAYADFQQVVNRFPDSQYAPDAEERMIKLRQDLAFYELYVADFYMRRGAYVAAAGRAQTVIENFQGTPSVRRALRTLAEAYHELELHDLKEDVVRVLEMNYPDDPALSRPIFSPVDRG